MRAKKKIIEQLEKAKADYERECNSRTKGYIDALEWVLNL
jgi:hypothetical protein